MPKIKGWACLSCLIAHTLVAIFLLSYVFPFDAATPFKEVFTALLGSNFSFIHSLLRLEHILGLVLGGGSVLVLDFYILRFLVNGIVLQSDLRIILFISKLVVAGIILLWQSGIGFLIFYYLYDGPKLLSGKIAAKAVIVSILTVNGFLIHKVVLPKIEKNCDASLFCGLSRIQLALFTSIGIISGASWLSAIFLGVFIQLNAFPMWTILQVYAVVVLSVVLLNIYVIMALGRVEEGDSVKRI